MYTEIQMHRDPRTCLYRAELIVHGGPQGPVHALITDPHPSEELCLLEVAAWQEQQGEVSELPPEPDAPGVDVAGLRELLAAQPWRWLPASGPTPRHAHPRPTIGSRIAKCTATPRESSSTARAPSAAWSRRRPSALWTTRGPWRACRRSGPSSTPAPWTSWNHWSASCTYW